eukprot:1177857-Prorocentrum_minimum.AAC.1
MNRRECEKCGRAGVRAGGLTWAMGGGGMYPPWDCEPIIMLPPRCSYPPRPPPLYPPPPP